MSQTTTKALAIARGLQDVWTKEFTADFTSIVESFDSTGNPVLTLSNGTVVAGNPVAIVRVRPITWTALDVLGNASQIYTPHTIDLCTESNSITTGADILSAADLLPLFGEIVKTGTTVSWYKTANGVVPSVSAMVPGNLAATFADLYWNASKAQ